MAERYVGVRELKARLSEYLRQVKNGNTVVVTKHGMPVGRLTPVGLSAEERMQGVVEAGRAEWNGKHLTPIKPVARTKKGYSVAELLIDDRR
jgi:prevent-host-death family protein